MEVVTISILVRHPPLNEEQVLDERLVLLLPGELVEFAEERKEARKNKCKPKTRVYIKVLNMYVSCSKLRQIVRLLTIVENKKKSKMFCSV